MKKVSQLNYYEILDVKPTATKAEIQNSYSRLWKIYQPDSLAIYSILSGQEREEMLSKVENAYTILMDDIKRNEYDQSIGLKTLEVAIKPHKHKQSENIFEAINVLEEMNRKMTEEKVVEGESIDPLKHDFLKCWREQKSISLKEISESTNISTSMLSALENGEYDKLPGRTYAIGFLKAYAQYIGLDYQLARQNMEKWSKWGSLKY